MPTFVARFIRGLRRRNPAVDLVRVQDALPEGTADFEVLAWAASVNRDLITNDRNTMVAFARQRAFQAEHVPGLIVTTNEQSVGSTIDDILVIAECISESEAAAQLIYFLPLR